MDISIPPTFAITGSKKRRDEGALLFTVRVDGVVGLLVFAAIYLGELIHYRCL